MRKDFKNLDIYATLQPGNGAEWQKANGISADWKTPEHIEVKPVYTKEDLEGMEQVDCADRMEVSRQTFQRILNVARQKIADSLTNGKAIRIEGGNYTRNICPVKCLDCGKQWSESYENFERL